MNSSKSVLFIRYKKPFGIKEGGEQATHKNYSILCELFGIENVEEYYVHPNLEHETVWDKIKGLPYIFANYYFGLTPRKVREIYQIAQNKDIVFIDRSIFGIVAKALKKNGYSGKIVSFFHNVEVVYYQARIPKYAPYRPFLLHCIDKNDAYTIQYSDLTICLNPRDENELLKRYGKKIDAVIPITFEDRHPNETSVSIASPPVALFFGAYFPANVDGILWFIEHVLPHVDIHLQIVGKGMYKLACHVETHGRASLQKINIFSDVEDVSPFFEQADFVISPIFKGSGMKVKTCETLMYGKTIIGTTESFEGYNVDFEKVGALANTKDEFIAAIQQISQKFNSKFNMYSRDYFLQNHTNEVAKKVLEKLLLP
ncbi:MAG: glycosyltransferase family 4 protein [Bacteroidales bacterium]|nr:glycosyltransferase family 4 protein [Bacteroidales bacterium]